MTKRTTERVVKKLDIVYDVPIFDKYIKPLGWLDEDMACQALFRYYLAAQPAWYDWDNQLVLEGDEDKPKPNFKGLFTTFAQAYGVAPERMTKFWPEVDMQCFSLGLPKMPAGDEFRFNVMPEIRSQ